VVELANKQFFFTSFTVVDKMVNIKREKNIRVLMTEITTISKKIFLS